jgi:thiol-disulfide isomerase/thioredoxin
VKSVRTYCVKEGLVFLSLLFYFTLVGQNTVDSLPVLTLKNEVIEFYSKQNTLCYTFKEKYHVVIGKCLLSHGKVMCYKEGNETYYRAMHLLDTLNIKYESVKNKDYFGVNHFYRNEYFNDYKLLPEKKRYYAFNYQPKDILKPDTSLRTSLFDPKFFSVLSSNKQNYILELTDTNKVERGPENVRYKTIKMYHISKKDFSIQKYSAQYFWTSGDLYQSDSLVRTYNYCKEPLKKIEEYVNSFQPLKGERPVLPKFPKDTLTIFPEFHLPDSMNNLKEPALKYALVDFWYKACGPCLANMKHLDKIANKNIEIITVNVMDSVDKDVRTIMSKHNFTFLFKGKDLAKQLNIAAYPTMYVIDKNRNILLKKIGFGSSEELDELLEKLNSDNK